MYTALSGYHNALWLTIPWPHVWYAFLAAFFEKMKRYIEIWSFAN